VGDAARPRHLARRGLAIPGQRPPSRSPPRASSVAPPSAAPPASSRGRPTDTAASEGREGRLHVLQVLAPKTHHDVAVQEELLVDIKVRISPLTRARNKSDSPPKLYLQHNRFATTGRKGNFWYFLPDESFCHYCPWRRYYVSISTCICSCCLLAART
jgi:hypothetical protein